MKRVLEVTRETIGPDADGVDRDGRWPAAGIRALQEAGLGGLLVPRQYGGAGHGLVALAQVCEIIGRECPSTALCFGMHCVGSAVISAKATDEQCDRYLAPICAGRHITTLSLSEPGTGAHFYLPQTRLQTLESGDFLLNGIKSFVTNGGHADSYVVSAKTDENDHEGDEFSCIVLPADSEGLSWGSAWSGLGMRGNSSVTLELREVPVRHSDLLGRVGDQIWYVFNVVAPCFLLAMAGTYLGVAAAAADEARDNLKRRRYSHSGDALGDQPVLQHQLGILWSRVEQIRRLVYHAAHSHDSGADDAALKVLAAKAETDIGVIDVVNQAMTMAGGIAYREGARLQRLLRDARAAPVMSPTTDLLRIWLGRALLDRPLLGP
ncbi:MAG: acyl-CoA dehydrogenase family protein [Arenicellales bacterium]